MGKPRALLFGLTTLAVGAALGVACISIAVRSFCKGSDALAAMPASLIRPTSETVVKVNGSPVRVLSIPTGTVSIKSCHAVGCLPESFPYLLRFLAIVTDGTVGVRLPIWSYAIVHPEGVFMVDAGAPPDYNDQATWAPGPVDGKLMRGFLRIDTSIDEALPVRLATAGIGPENVRALVLTHQHVDHTGGVPSFPSSDVWTAASEDAASKFIGAVPFRWRSQSTKIRYVDEQGRTDPDDGEPFPSIALTQDGALRAYHTPGHTPGSITVRLRTDDGDLWFVGDTSFRATDVDPARPTTGMHFNMVGARAVQRWLQARPGKVRFLTAHEDGR